MNISDAIKVIVNDDNIKKDCVFDEIHLNGMAYAGDKKKNKAAKISISVNPLICIENLSDLDKWRLIIVAIPQDKISEIIKRKGK